MHRVLFACLFVCSICAQTNGGFEDGEVGAVPPGWTLPSSLAKAGFGARLVEQGCRTGKCAEITGVQNPPPQMFGNLMQVVPAGEMRMRKVRLSAAVRVDTPDSRAQMWLRLDTESGMAFLDNMAQRPIRSSAWDTYTIEADVTAEVKQIVIGVMLFGPGKAYVDDVKLEAIGELIPDKVEPARPLSDIGLRNLTAFSKLYGYVRFFHPSDQVVQADWDAFAIDGVRAIEGVETMDELATRLQELFSAVAPTVRVSTGRAEVDLPKGPETIRFAHHGVELAAQRLQYSPYRTTRERSAAVEGVAPKLWEAELIPGLRAVVPLEVYVEARKTLPSLPMPESKQIQRSATDRATRLAGVIIAWNVMQHFYPYFDVVQTDWAAEQSKALRAAATDTTVTQFQTTMRKLIAALNDGHGNVHLPGSGGQMVLTAPVTLDFVEGQVLVTRVHKGAPAEIAAGDRVVKIDGKAAEAAADEARLLISGATHGWIDAMARGYLTRCGPSKQMTLEVEPLSGPAKSVTVTCGQPRFTADTSTETRPEEIVKELEPGFLYVDLTRIQEAEWKQNVERMAAAKGIVFDMRGYPGQPALRALAHSTEKTIRCARWNIPTPSKPDQVDVTFAESGWDVQPEAPYFKGARVFLTDGRAISYAETVMGIVENYKLGEIVGSPTAGTNGNVNPFKLPGGLTVMWTGMKVLKHDKSQHHGIGILPTVPVARTRKGVAEGKDEVLLRGLEVVKAKVQ